MQSPQTLWRHHYIEIRNTLRLAIPVSTGLLLNRMLPFVSVVFVGHLGPAELAAASLGSSLLNIVGLAVMAGLAGAITTSRGQAYGAKQYPLVGYIWQRAIIILGLLCIPICVLLLFAQPILLATGQTPRWLL